MSVRYPDSVGQCHDRIAKLENDVEVTQNALDIAEALTTKLRRDNAALVIEREALLRQLAEEINHS